MVDVDGPEVLMSNEVMSVAHLVEYQIGGIVSRQLVKKQAGNVTAFAFDTGQELSKHTSPFDALIEVVEGEAEISLSGQVHRVREGEMILLPAYLPHAVKARSRFTSALSRGAGEGAFCNVAIAARAAFATDTWLPKWLISLSFSMARNRGNDSLAPSDSNA
jgi:quercetin dioxygenase-like cupin family protein